MMDEDGFVYFRQRIKRMIITSGYNVYPSQIENIIDGYDKVLYSCVIGVKDPYKVQKVKAFVVLKPGVEPSDAVKEELMAYCRKQHRQIRHALRYRIPLRAAQDARGQGCIPDAGRRRKSDGKLKNAV